MINKRKSHRVIIYAALVLGGFLLGSVNGTVANSRW